MGGVVLEGFPAGPGWILFVCVDLLCVPPLPVVAPVCVVLGWLGDLPAGEVPAEPGRGVVGCLGAVFLVVVPAVPGWDLEASNAPPFGTVVPAAPGRGLPDCLGADAPGCPCVVWVFDVLEVWEVLPVGGT